MCPRWNRIKHRYQDRKRLKDLKYHYEQFQLLFMVEDLNEKWFNNNFNLELLNAYQRLGERAISWRKAMGVYI